MANAAWCASRSRRQSERAPRAATSGSASFTTRTETRAGWRACCGSSRRSLRPVRAPSRGSPWPPPSGTRPFPCCRRWGAHWPRCTPPRSSSRKPCLRLGPPPYLPICNPGSLSCVDGFPRRRPRSSAPAPNWSAARHRRLRRCASCTATSARPTCCGGWGKSSCSISTSAPPAIPPWTWEISWRSCFACRCASPTGCATSHPRARGYSTRTGARPSPIPVSRPESPGISRPRCSARSTDSRSTPRGTRARKDCTGGRWKPSACSRWGRGHDTAPAPAEPIPPAVRRQPARGQGATAVRRPVHAGCNRGGAAEAVAAQGHSRPRDPRQADPALAARAPRGAGGGQGAAADGSGRRHRADRARSGDLLTKIAGDTNTLKDVFADSILKFTSYVLTVAGMLAIMVAIDWKIGLIAFATLPFLAYSLLHLYRKTKLSVKTQKKQEGKVASRMSEVLQAVPLVQAFARERYEAEQFDAVTQETVRESIRVARLEAAATRSSEIITALGTAAAVLFGAFQVLQGRMLPGELVLVVGYLTNMYKPIRQLAKLSTDFSKAMAAAERVSEILEIEPEILDRPDAIPARDR